MLQAPTASDLPWELIQRLILVVAVAVSILALRRVTRDGRRWGDVLRRRFVLGVPWGTVLTVVGVLSVYWFVQGGWENPRRPLTIPFYSWSYFYPLGTLTAPFAHENVGHITGNLRGTVLFAPIVEYVVGHYPRERGSETFSSLRTNPYVRILAVPAASLVIGVFTGIFSMGPVIGFSGVVYAYMGFAVVSRPLLAVFALLGDRVVDLVYRSLRNPQISREPSPGIFTPGWADVAIQGHAIGILVGVCLGIVLLERRNERPNSLFLWFAALVFGVRQSLWAIYRPVGESGFVLYRAVGLGLIFLFAALVVSALVGSERRLLRRFDLPRRKSAFLVLVLLLGAVSGVAVPFGLTSISGDLPEDAETVDVRDYSVTYVEGVPNQYVSVVDEFVYDESTQIRSSGVVVISEDRRIWLESVSKSDLAFRGWAAVRVGGLGWRETIYASREGWSLVGNDSAYKVSLRRNGGERHLVHATDSVRAEPVIAGRNVSIVPTDDGFDAIVTSGGRELGRAAVPSQSNRSVVGGLTLNRTDRKLFAVYNETRVRVGEKSVPRARQG